MSGAEIYNLAYKLSSKNFVMGTDVDKRYSSETKGILVRMCSLKPNSNLLDYGSGNGRLGDVLDPQLQGLKWHAVDFSYEGLRHSKKQYGHKIIPVNASGEDLPFADNSFDAVIAADSLEHIPDTKKAFSEIHRVLSPGGVLAFNVPLKNSLPNWFINNFIKERPSLELASALFRSVLLRMWYFGKLNIQPIENDLTFEGVKQIMDEYGFRVDEVEYYPGGDKLPMSMMVAARKLPTASPATTATSP